MEENCGINFKNRKSNHRVLREQNIIRGKKSTNNKLMEIENREYTEEEITGGTEKNFVLCALRFFTLNFFVLRFSPFFPLRALRLCGGDFYYLFAVYLLILKVSVLCVQSLPRYGGVVEIVI